MDRQKLFGALAAVGLSLTAAGCSNRVDEDRTCHQDGDGFLVTQDNKTGNITVLDARYSWEVTQDGKFCQSKEAESGMADIPYKDSSKQTPYKAIEDAIELFGYDPGPEPEPGV